MGEERKVMLNHPWTILLAGVLAGVPAAIVTGLFSIHNANTASQTQSEIRALKAQLQSTNAKITWPIKGRTVEAFETVAGWSTAMPVGKELYVVIPTAENNRQRVYRYPVQTTVEVWHTPSPVPLCTATADYQLYAYALPKGTPQIGDTGLPTDTEPLDVLQVSRSLNPPNPDLMKKYGSCEPNKPAPKD